jgi:hypothetical protein
VLVACTQPFSFVASQFESSHGGLIGFEPRQDFSIFRCFDIGHITSGALRPREGRLPGAGSAARPLPAWWRATPARRAPRAASPRSAERASAPPLDNCVTFVIHARASAEMIARSLRPQVFVGAPGWMRICRSAIPRRSRKSLGGLARLPDTAGQQVSAGESEFDDLPALHRL